MGQGTQQKGHSGERLSFRGVRRPSPGLAPTSWCRVTLTAIHSVGTAIISASHMGKLRLRGAGHVLEAGEQGSLPNRKPCSRGQRRQDGALRGVRVTEAAPRGASARDPFRGSRGTSGLSSRAPWPPGGPRAPDSDPGVYLPVSTKAAIQGSYFLRADPHWGSQGPPAPAGQPSRPVAQLGAKTLSESHSAYGRLIRDFQS